MMMRDSFRVLSLGLLFFVCVAAPLWLEGQESIRPRGEATASARPSVSFPASLMDSMQEQINPHQPRRLQSLLMKPEVQAELGIDRGTYSLVTKALTDVRAKQSEMTKQMLQGDTSDREAMKTRMESMRALQVESEQATQEALTEIFPPQGYQRLKQIALQIQIQEAGLGNVLLHGILAEDMKFTDAQLETLSKRADEYEQEKQAKWRALQEEYNAKLLAHLTPQQRQFFEQQVGEAFSYDPVSTEMQSFQRVKELRERFGARISQ